MDGGGFRGREIAGFCWSWRFSAQKMGVERFYKHPRSFNKKNAPEKWMGMEDETTFLSFLGIANSREYDFSFFSKMPIPFGLSFEASGMLTLASGMVW